MLKGVSYLPGDSYLEKAKKYLVEFEEHKGGDHWRDGAIAWALLGIGEKLEVIATELGSVRVEALEERMAKLEQKVEELYEILRLDRKIKRLIGQNRFKKCIYSVQGYCQEEGHVVDPKTVSVNTVEKDGRFYPQITWIDWSGV